MAVQTVI